MITELAAYESINLRFNPFGTLDRETRAQLAIVDTKPFLSFVEGGCGILQFTGKKGRGKSSHLLALHQYFKETPFVQYHKGRPFEFPSGKKIFVDNLENLPFYLRLHLYRQYDFLAVTTHKNLVWEMLALGKTVKNIRVSHHNSEQILARFNHRIEYARLNKGELPLITLEKVLNLQAKYGNDIRAMEEMLYDEFYELDSKGKHGTNQNKNG